jgi:hypothetical protein
LDPNFHPDIIKREESLYPPRWFLFCGNNNKMYYYKKKSDKVNTPNFITIVFPFQQIPYTMVKLVHHYLETGAPSFRNCAPLFRNWCTII